MKRRVIITACACITSALIFSACGGSDDTETSANGDATNTESGEVQELDFIWFSDGVEGEATQRIIDEYEQDNNVDITLIETPYGDLENKLTVMVTGDDAPDMTRITNVAKFKDSLVSIGDYVDDADAKLDEFMDADKLMYYINGEIKALPTDVTANGLIYNKTAFENAGVEVPTSEDDIWTTDEWIDAMKEVQESGEVRYGLVIDKSAHRWSTLLYEQGGRHIDDEGNVVINSPEGVAAVDLMVQLHEDGIAPESVWVGEEDPNNLFRTGQVAMHLSGSWMMTNYRDNIKDFDWGVTYLPEGEMRSSVVGGKYVGAFDGTGNEEASVDFLNYFTSTEANAQYCMDSLFLSPRKDNASLDYDFGEDFFKIFSEELAVTPTYTSSDFANPYYMPAIQNELIDGLSDCIAGLVDPQTMLDDIAEQGQLAIDEEF